MCDINIRHIFWADNVLAPGTVRRRFQLLLIKPSRYDDDGYVIQWLRSSIPSNSLAALYGLAADAEARRVLGSDVAIDIQVLDEVNTRVKVESLLALLRQHGSFGLVGLVGVQSNQFPRALDLARSLRAAGVPVVIGGFHVSGCLAMLPQMPRDLQEALDLGISLFAGEAEDGRLDTVLRDAAFGRLKPIYNHIDDLPNITGTPAPYLPAETVRAQSSTMPASTPGAAVRSSARSAPSSMCRAASPGAAPPMMSNP
jgi:hypothetical protein